MLKMVPLLSLQMVIMHKPDDCINKEWVKKKKSAGSEHKSLIISVMSWCHYFFSIKLLLLRHSA